MIEDEKLLALVYVSPFGVFQHDAESQEKMDKYARQQKDRAGKKSGGERVMVAATTEDSDDDDVNHYFIGAVATEPANQGDDVDDDEECIYSPSIYSVLISTCPAPINDSLAGTGGMWSGAAFVLTCTVIAICVGYLSVWCLALVGYVGNMFCTNQLRILATRIRRPQPSPFDNEQLLFDNQAGISMVKNTNALINVQQLPSRRVISGISGDASAIVVESDGELPGLPGVRFLVAPNASANILAECDARNAGWTVSLDDGVYVVSTPEARLEFKTMPGWHAHPACALPTSAAALVTTVAGNLSKYSAAEQAYAAKARQLQNRMGLPCADYMISGLSGIDNAGVSPADVRRATAIAGPPVAKVRGGTIHTATPAQRIEAEMPRTTPVPLTMEIDIFFWQGLSFLIGVLLPINYVMATYLKHRTVAEIGAGITGFITAAKARKFDTTLVQCDGEKAVAAYKDELNRTGVKLESQPGVHCPHVERVNRTIGEYVRGQQNGGCVFNMCKALVVMCVLFKVSRLNLLPTKSSTDGFGAFVHYEGIRVDANRDLTFAFGDYAETTKTNTTAKAVSRTEACVLGIPTMNRAGSVICLKVSTGQMVTRQRFTLVIIRGNSSSRTRLTQLQLQKCPHTITMPWRQG